MKKSFLTCAAVIALVTTNPVYAQKTTYTNNNFKTDLREITLDKSNTTENYYDNVLMASEETPAVNNNTTSMEESSAVEKKDKKISLEKIEERFQKIYNLKGGVTASAPSGKLAEEKTLVKQWIDGDYATGKWFGARPVLEDHGLTINSSLLYSPFMKTSGGASGEGSGKGYSLFNLGVTLDTEKAGLWKGGTFFTLYQRKTGYGISGANGQSGAMGDWMGLDGWDWRQINQISECWYQQKFWDNKLRLKVGKQDSNTDFAYLNSGWDFINTAFSVNPTIPMPTYPDQSFGFMAEINPKEWLSIRNGIYSKFNIPFNITEIEVKPTIKKLPGRYSIGAWEMSDSNNSGMNVQYMDYGTNTAYSNYFNRNYGAYAQFEQMVYKEKKDDENDMQGLVVFGQFGASPSNRNDMNRYVGGGLHYQGLIPKRDKDKAGVAIASGSFAPRLGDITSQVGDETVVEAFYRVQVSPWFYLQPDVQFITRPSGYYDSSVAIGLRTVITF